VPRFSWNHRPRDQSYAAWFAAIAERLLNRFDLIAAGRRLRILEVELYYHSDDHPDPFSHRQPIQRECGRWYFHRVGTSYRGGTFKGLDLTLGDGAAHFGVLIRSVHDGKQIIEGPSRLVEELLRLTGIGSIRELDGRIAGRTAWDASSPLFLEKSKSPRADVIVATARIGLALKRPTTCELGPRYLGFPYRFLTEPRLRKGRSRLALALHARGESADSIANRMGMTLSVVERYLAAFDAGRTADFTSFFGRDLTSIDVCRLLGAWHAAYGQSS
jgi:hypothetical protein